MAHPDILPNAVLDEVAKQIGTRLASVGTVEKLRTARVELAESFSVWMLGLEPIARRDENINRLPRDTGLYHHQIAYNGRGEAYARSAPSRPGVELRVLEEISESTLAVRTAAAIDWIDEHIKDDPLVRLLVVPSYFLHAFWLHYPRADKILVVDRPVEYELLRYDVLYDFRELFHMLANEKPVQGLPPAPREAAQ